MTKTVIDLLFNKANMLCTACRSPRGTCRCWVTVRCPGCNKTVTDRRKKEDGDADEVEIPCPACFNELWEKENA